MQYILYETKNYPVLQGVCSSYQVYYCYTSYHLKLANDVIALQAHYELKMEQMCWQIGVNPL